jgi:branched-chain amino acid transport system permease protein
MRRARLLGVGLVLLLLGLAPHALSSYLLALLTQAVISAMLAMSLDLLLGYTGLASLGHAAYLVTTSLFPAFISS